MAESVCPVWVGHILASPFRKLIQNPERILEPYLKNGMMVLDIGSAMGFFSLPMAKMVSPNGRVICVDMQENMLTGLKKRASKAGVLDNIQTVTCNQSSLNIDKFKEKIDFALLFAVLHEIPDQQSCLKQISSALKPGSKILFAEPSGHVEETAFEKSLVIMEQNNLHIIEHLKIKSSYGVIGQKVK